MVSTFLIYDLILLFAFLIFFSAFLYARKHNLKKEGLLFIYRTSWGIKLINLIGKKYKKTLNFLSYISIFTGYVLVIGMLWLTYRLVKIYFFSPEIVRAIRVPPILPLFPYLPQAFNLNFLPPFYFTYWIIILAVIAITHEMAHGIFAVHDKVKIKTTGFGFFPFFLPIFLAAFVELDEKAMEKKKKFSQLAILSAGTFANVITAIVFFFVLWGFFATAFTASGVVYDSYATSQIAISGIASVNGINLSNPSYENVLELVSEEGLTEIKTSQGTYLANKQVIQGQEENSEILILYNDGPAIRNNLSSIIVEFNGKKVYSVEDLGKELGKYRPGDKVIITTIESSGIAKKEIILGEHPDNPETAWLGVGFANNAGQGLIQKIANTVSFKKPNVYYEPKFDGISVFIYHLLWWLVLISISVALVNMLPVGIFDGGRFFYLTVLGITGNEKFAKKTFAFSTWFFLFLLFLIMIMWGVSWF